jgi:hypothetical protein
VGGDLDLLGRGQGAQGGDHLVHDLFRRDAFPARRPLARFQPRQLQEIRDERGHAVGGGRDALQEAPRDGWILHSAVFQGLHEPANRRQGRAQLVGRVGDEVAPDLVHAAALRHVLEGQHRAVRHPLLAGEGPGLQGVDAPQVMDAHLQGLWPARAQSRLQRASDLGVTDHLDVVPAQRVGQVEAAAQAVVGQEDGAAVVHGEEPAVDGGEDRLRARALAASSLRRAWSWSAERSRMRASSPISSWREMRVRAERSPAAKRCAEAIISRRGPARGAARAMASTTAIAKARARARATEARDLPRLLLDAVEGEGPPAPLR